MRRAFWTDAAERFWAIWVRARNASEVVPSRHMSSATTRRQSRNARHLGRGCLRGGGPSSSSRGKQVVSCSLVWRQRDIDDDWKMIRSDIALDAALVDVNLIGHKCVIDR